MIQGEKEYVSCFYNLSHLVLPTLFSKRMYHLINYWFDLSTYSKMASNMLYIKIYLMSATQGIDHDVVIQALSTP